MIEIPRTGIFLLALAFLSWIDSRSQVRALSSETGEIGSMLFFSHYNFKALASQSRTNSERGHILNVFSPFKDEDGCLVLIDHVSVLPYSDLESPVAGTGIAQMDDLSGSKKTEETIALAQTIKELVKQEGSMHPSLLMENLPMATTIMYPGGVEFDVGTEPDGIGVDSGNSALAQTARAFQKSYHELVLDVINAEIDEELKEWEGQYERVIVIESKSNYGSEKPLDRWVRDQVIVYTDHAGESFISPRLRTSPVTTKALEKAEKKCSFNLKPGSLPIEGGNLFVLDSIAIVGRESFVRHYSDISVPMVVQNLIDIGVDPPYSLNLEKRVASGLASKLGVKQVYWMGTERKCICPVSHTCYNQAFYHLDLFFSPVCVDNSTGKNVLRGFVGMPVTSANQTSIPAEIGYDPWSLVRANVFDCVNYLASSLEKDSITLDLDTLEVPLLWSEANKRFIAVHPLCNGLIETKEDKRVYFMPEKLRTDGKVEEWLKGYSKKAENVLIRSGLFDQVRLVPSSGFSHDSALRCRAVPLSRK